MSVADEIRKLQEKATLDELAADRAAKREFDKIYYQTIIETAKGSIDRARSSGELVEKAAAAIGTLYAAVIGVSFSVTERPISARAIIPVLFLGLAIVGSMVYLAFPTPGEAVPPLEPTTARPERLRREAERYVLMVQELIGRRLYFLRASVVALGVGLVCLPAPFVSDPARADTVPAASTSPSTPVTFPPPPDVHNEAQAQVAAIRYQAEIDEVVAARSTKSSTQQNWPVWAWFMVGGGIVVTLGVPALMWEPADI